MTSFLKVAAFALAALGLTSVSLADWIELRDGTRIENCYVRDEGPRLLVWETMDAVGTDNYRVVPRKDLKAFKLDRDASVWDKQPPLPDLTITHIELSPKLPGLHGVVQYDKWGRPKIAGNASALNELEPNTDPYLHPEKIVEGLQFQYESGQQVTLTAHVKNIGFEIAKSFSYVWLIDGKELARGQSNRPLLEGQIIRFEQPWTWQDGFHHVTFRIVNDEPEIAKINNELREALWAFPFTYVVSNGRVAAWHEFRSGYGTFSFEDYYRWHLDIMNLMFARSIYPATPDGCKARVRLDRLIYADRVQGNVPYVDDQPVEIVREDGLRYDAGGWMWNDSDQELETGEWIQVNPDWRNATEWSLPHELGHQLGLVDWYALDYGGGERHLMPDNGEKITHWMRYPVQMMHWHGPQGFGEADAAYLNDVWNQPRGYYGEVYFALPRECFLRVVDINGQPVADAEVEICQRGVKLDPNGEPAQDKGVTYYPVIEDGDFYSPEVGQVTKDPVIVGRTDADGMLRLPNRPVKPVKTLAGYERQPNPFGNQNVVGQRQIMQVKITHNGRPTWHFLEGHDFVVAWYRGHKDKYTTVLETPYGSADSPPPPTNVTATRLDAHHVKLTWDRPDIGDEYNYTYLEKPIGYKVYRRVSNMGLNDRPWFEEATVGPETFEVTLDLRQQPADVYWFSKVSRFGVTTLAASSVESALAETLADE